MPNITTNHAITYTNRAGFRKVSSLKISFDDVLPLRIGRTLYVKITKFQGFVMTVVHSDVEQESVSRCKRGKSAQQSPSHTTSPGAGHET